MAVQAKLLDALEKKLDLSRSQVNRRIGDEAARKHLTRELAAISLAATARLPIHRFATPGQLAELRGAAPVTAAPMVTADIVPKPTPLPKRGGARRIKATKDNSMFVVHGRDTKLNQDMYSFL